jgi:hypothetical protein
MLRKSIVKYFLLLFFALNICLPSLTTANTEYVIPHLDGDPPSFIFMDGLVSLSLKTKISQEYSFMHLIFYYDLDENKTILASLSGAPHGTLESVMKEFNVGLEIIGGSRLNLENYFGDQSRLVITNSMHFSQFDGVDLHQQLLKKALYLDLNGDDYTVVNRLPFERTPPKASPLTELSNDRPIDPPKDPATKENPVKKIANFCRRILGQF